jgi:hypothetical protein
MSRVHEMRGGRDNDPRFGSRMRGAGEMARLLERRFALACRRYGYNAPTRSLALDTTLFRVPPVQSGQMSLFDG